MTASSLESHSLGLFGSALEFENEQPYLFYHGVRYEAGVPYASIGVARLKPECVP